MNNGKTIVLLMLFMTFFGHVNLQASDQVNVKSSLEQTPGSRRISPSELDQLDPLSDTGRSTTVLQELEVQSEAGQNREEETESNDSNLLKMPDQKADILEELLQQ